MFTYLIINILSIAVPFIRSFDKRVRFYTRWKYLFPSTLITGAFFIIWDILFTKEGVWGFNPRYLVGVDLFHLPLEEWLFFVTIPYACVFIYDVLNYFVKKDYLGKYAYLISLVFIALLALLAVFNTGKLYTFTTFTLTALFLILHLFVIKSDYLGRFYLAYLVIIIPFLVVNGILTGSFLAEPIVWYNNAENLAIRIFTIPVEDTIYGMLLILMNITIYEYLQKRPMLKKTT